MRCTNFFSIIAQRFNAGKKFSDDLLVAYNANPALKRWAIIHR
jgi:hypothetical protein